MAGRIIETKNKTTGAAGIARSILLSLILIACSLAQTIEKFLSAAMSALNPAAAYRDSALFVDSPQDEAEFEEFKWLAKHTPCFEVDSANIEVLQTPGQFYDNLKVSSSFDE